MENNTIFNIQSEQILKEEIFFTEKAISEVKAIKIKNNIPENNFLKIGVKGGGCSGYTYVMDFTDSKKESDHYFKFEEIEVIVDQKSMFFISGITIDYSDGLNGKGFVFNNPQATKTCGCGTSFGV